MKWFSLALLLALSGAATAAPNKEAAAPKTAAAKSAAAKSAEGASTTEHSFDDMLVQGKYHFSDEAVTTVEEDKVLDALIGVRTEFKDRLQQSAGLN